MTVFTNTSIRLLKKYALNAQKNLRQLEGSNRFVLNHAKPSDDQRLGLRHLSDVKNVTLDLGQSTISPFNIVLNNVHTQIGAELKNGSGLLQLEELQVYLNTISTRVKSYGLTFAKNVALTLNGLKARTLTTLKSCALDGFVNRVIFDGTSLVQKAELFQFRYKYTGKKAKLQV
jgi:hypothetical protein